MMDKILEDLLELFKGDTYAAQQGMVIEAADAQSARCSLTLRDDQKNALGYAQGGLLYTLADFAFAAAANAAGPRTVTLNSTIHYMRNVKEGKITANARLVSRTRSTCVCQVELTDEAGQPLALATMTGFAKAGTP